MGRFLIENLEATIAVGSVLFGGLALACLVGIWRLGRGRRFFIPAGLGRKAAAGGLLLASFFSLLVVIYLLGPVSWVSRGLEPIRDAVGRPVADLAFFRLEDGEPASLADFAGRATVLNLWATWCPPCIEEMPALERLEQTYGERGLAVVTLSDESPETLRAFARDHPDVPLGSNSFYAEDMGWLSSCFSRPVTLFIDREGVLREFLLGGTDYDGFERRARRLLG